MPTKICHWLVYNVEKPFLLVYPDFSRLPFPWYLLRCHIIHYHPHLTHRPLQPQHFHHHLRRLLFFSHHACSNGRSKNRLNTNKPQRETHQLQFWGCQSPNPFHFQKRPLPYQEPRLIYRHWYQLHQELETAKTNCPVEKPETTWRG